MNCAGCNGSGSCDPCDGYGFYPDSSPGAGDGPDCEVCDSLGCCPDCHGAGIQDNDIQDNGTRDNDMQDSGFEQGSDVSVG
jgi:hypothetical protein